MPAEYFDLAINSARQQTAKLASLTHWTVYDAPIYRGTQQAACGAIVRLSKFSGEPSCPACRQQQAIYDAMEF
jgi:hypothetical protein